MSYQADPFDALGKSYNALKGAAQDGAMNRAGRAYASGDVRGASNALAQGGMVGDAMALDQSQAQARRQATEDDYKMAERRSEYLGQGTSYLLTIPVAQRPQALAAMEPTLRPLVGDDVWRQIQSYELTDENLRAFGAAIEKESGRLFQRRDGSVIEVRPNGQSRVVVEGLPYVDGGFLVSPGQPGPEEDEWEIVNPNQPARGQPERAQQTGVSFRTSQEARQAIGRIVPGVTFTSGYRSPERNRRVGGVPNSYHTKDRAWDLVPPPGMSMAQLAQTMRAQGFRALDEGDHVHVSW